jgi:FlaA1/EpsC-like NDP-sugar epimerase
MKAAKIVYIIMNIVMIFVCIGLAVFAMISGFNMLYLIAPIAALALFLFMQLNKSGDELKDLMKIVFSAHVAVMIVVTQAVFAFNVEIGNAFVLIAIAAVLIVFMIFALNKMLKKMAEFAQLNKKQEDTKNEE